MISTLAGWALILAALGYGVKYWLSAKHLGAWPTACAGLRLLWLLMAVGCVARGIQLALGSDQIHSFGGVLIFVICAVSAAEAMAMIKAGRFPLRPHFPHRA